MYAANHGLVLRSMEPYEPQYDLSSHRGADRPFRIGKQPLLYAFARPSKVGVPRSLQICCTHELHLELDGYPDELVNDVVNGDVVGRLAQSVVPNGVRVEVPHRQMLRPEDVRGDSVIVFSMIYCGEKIPITREEADQYRSDVETQMGKVVRLRQNRAGRMVSKPFPYSAVEQLIADLPT